MNTKSYNNRHNWLAIKQTIGINAAPSFLETEWDKTRMEHRLNRHQQQIEMQQTYYIDILAILSKISIFFKGLSSFFTFSFQTDWQKDIRTTSKMGDYSKVI